MRCPDCNKFVGYDTDGEPEADLEATADYGENGSIQICITGTIRAVLHCDQCGAELKEATFDVDENYAEQIPVPEPEPKTGDVLDCEVSIGLLAITDRTENKDRHGKPIKNPRYMKRMLGVEVEYEVKVAGETFGYTFNDELQASAWDELV